MGISRIDVTALKWQAPVKNLFMSFLQNGYRFISSDYSEMLDIYVYRIEMSLKFATECYDSGFRVGRTHITYQCKLYSLLHLV